MPQAHAHAHSDAYLESSDHSRLVAVLLCWFLGVFGAHRFYVGKHGTAVLMIVTLGGFGVWWFIDMLIVLLGQFRDVEGRRVYLWMEPDAY